MDSAAAQDAEQIGNQFAAAFASFDQIDKRDEAGILSTHRTCKDLLCQLGLTFVDLAADLQHDGRITEGIRNTFVRLDGDRQARTRFSSR